MCDFLSTLDDTKDLCIHLSLRDAAQKLPNQHNSFEDTHLYNDIQQQGLVACVVGNVAVHWRHIERC